MQLTIHPLLVQQQVVLPCQDRMQDPLAWGLHHQWQIQLQQRQQHHNSQGRCLAQQQLPGALVQQLLAAAWVGPWELQLVVPLALLLLLACQVVMQQ